MGKLESLFFLLLLTPLACGGEGSLVEQTFLDLPDSYWAGALCSQDAEVRLRAREQLVNGGRESLPVLLNLTSHPSPGVATEIEAVFREMNADVVDALQESLLQAESQRASAAAQALGYMGAAASSAAPGLAALLESGDVEGRVRAAWALGRIAPEDDGRTSSRLRKALESDKEERVRMWAAEALGVIGARKETVAALVSGTRDSSHEVVLSCIRALGSLAPAAGEAVPRLSELLANHKERQVRWAAAKALGEQGAAAASAIPALERALEDAPPGAEPPAAAAIRQIRAALENNADK